MGCEESLRSFVERLLKGIYLGIEAYALRDPLFLHSLEPVEVEGDVHPVVREMAEAAKLAGVGPMAAVAGAIAEHICDALVAKGCRDVVVENGGDIAMRVEKEKLIGIYAGDSIFSQRLGFRIRTKGKFGLCTSAGIGHSISFGWADAVCVFSKSAALADAAATAIANLVRDEHSLEAGVEEAKRIRGCLGVLLIKGEKLVAWGKLPELVRL